MLDPLVRDALVREARRLLGTPYFRAGFNCLDFVRAVYAQVGMTVPKLDRNITHDQLDDPPTGHCIYFIRPDHKGKKRWSHVGILTPGGRCIHASGRLGQVVESSLEELFGEYELATPQTPS